MEKRDVGDIQEYKERIVSKLKEIYKTSYVDKELQKEQKVVLKSDIERVDKRLSLVDLKVHFPETYQDINQEEYKSRIAKKEKKLKEEQRKRIKLREQRLSSA